MEKDMIPKTIHYCWFGRTSKPELYYRCRKSWEKHCPDYNIIEWNEDNFDIYSSPLYVQQAYEAKKWAFVTDYVRLKVVYDNGGVYLDTDVELKRNLDRLLKYCAYFGFESKKYINTGLGFGAIRGAAILKDLMRDYSVRKFIGKDGTADLVSCPIINKHVFMEYGLIPNGKTQRLRDNIKIFSPIYFCPLDYNLDRFHYSVRTISIHWFSASWFSEEKKKEHKQLVINRKRDRRKAIVDYVMHIPNYMGRFLLGRNYELLKRKLKDNKDE